MITKMQQPDFVSLKLVRHRVIKLEQSGGQRRTIQTQDFCQKEKVLITRTYDFLTPVTSNNVYGGFSHG